MRSQVQLNSVAAGVPRVPYGSRSSSEAIDRRLLSLDPRAAWRAFRREPLVFWLLCAYFFVEYVRPQTIWPVTDVVPWGALTLWGTLLAFLAHGRWKRPNGLDLLLGLFVVVLCLSGVFAFDPATSLRAWSLMLNWLLVYFLVTNVVVTQRRLFVFVGLFFLWCLKMSTFGARSFVGRGFGFTTWGISGPGAWLQNSGEFAVQMLMFLAMSFWAIVGLRNHLGKRSFWALLALLPGTAALTVIATSSRGGQLAMAVVFVILVAQSRMRVRGLVAVVVVAASLWVVVPDEQRTRFSEMGTDETSQRRLGYWEDGVEIAKEHPILGIGYQNWRVYYPRYYDPAGELPHNIFVQAGAELGFTGLFAFALLIAGTLQTNAQTRRRARKLPEWGSFLRCMAFGLDAAMVGFLVAGMFVTILYYPFFWVNLAFAGALSETTRRAARASPRARSQVHRLPGRMVVHEAASPVQV